MNNFGKLGHKVPARSRTFKAYWLEQLKKEDNTVQSIVLKSPNSSTAMNFKRVCLSTYVPKVKEPKKSYVKRILEGLPE